MINSAPLVTIYITCHNYAQYLDQAIKSVLEQEYENWELIIIDDGSEDMPEKVARKYLDDNTKKISFIRNENPIGLQKNANNVLGISNGEYLIRLDADDWLDPSALLLLVSKAEKDESIGLVFGGYFYVNQEGQIIGLEQQPNLWEDERTGSIPAHGACTLIRTRALKAVGGYSEDINAQDGWDLWFKLIKRVKSKSISSPIFYYRQHSLSLSQNKNKLYNARQKIFSKLKDSVTGSYKPKKVAVIPIKESYPDFEGVPYIEIFENKSLVEYVVDKAQSSNEFLKVIISTESDEVIRFVKKLIKTKKIDDVICFKRPTNNTGNSILVEKLINDAVEFFIESTSIKPDIVAFLSLHAPLRNTESISIALNSLQATELDTVVSVVEERSPVFRNSENGLELVGIGKFDGLFHRDEQLLRFNGQIIASWWDVVLQGSIWGGRVGYVEMPDDSDLQIKDIDSVELIKRKLNEVT